MPDFYRMNVAVYDRQDVINALLSFLTAGAGPNWTEDITWTAAGHPGELFLESTNAAAIGNPVAYYYFYQDPTSPFLLGGLVGCDAVAAGYGAGTGPATTALNITENPYGLGLYFDDSGTLVGGEGMLHMFGNEGRAIVCLRSNQHSMYTLLYIGAYTPHCAAVDDPCSIVSIGNSPGCYYTIEQLSGGSLSQTLPHVQEWQHAFPVGMLKYDDSQIDTLIPTFMRRYIQQGYQPSYGAEKITSNPDRRGYVPRNERAAPIEVFAYEQYINLTEKSKGEGFTLDGLYRCSDGIDIEDTITIGVNTYFIWPSAVQPDSNPRCMLIGPIGAPA